MCRGAEPCCRTVRGITRTESGLASGRVMLGVGTSVQAPCAHEGPRPTHRSGLWPAGSFQPCSSDIFFAFMAHFCRAELESRRSWPDWEQREHPLLKVCSWGSCHLLLVPLPFYQPKGAEPMGPASLAEQMGTTIHPRAQGESMWGSSSKIQLPVSPGSFPNCPLFLPTLLIWSCSSPVSLALLRIAFSTMLLGEYLFLRFFLPLDSESS